MSGINKVPDIIKIIPVAMSSQPVLIPMIMEPKPKTKIMKTPKIASRMRFINKSYLALQIKLKILKL